jgi:hypothetical protein
MEGQTDFFSANHKRLLNLATWAKYLAWVVLVIYLISALGVFNQNQSMYMSTGLFYGSSSKFIPFLLKNPVFGINMVIDILMTALNGLVYFLVLKGLALGVVMVVETDINYREKQSVNHE